MNPKMLAVAAMGVALIAFMRSDPPAAADTARSFDSCADLRAFVAAMAPYEELQLARQTFVCKEPLNPSADGLRIDFGDSLIRVADNALRPGLVVGDLETPPKNRHRDLTIMNLRIDGNGENQAFECWDGPCNPATNKNPLWQERSNGITINGCDDCTVINVHVTDARSGGMTVVSSQRLLVEGFRAERSCFDGLAAYHTHHSVFRNIQVHDNTYAGFSFDGDFSNNRIEDFVSRANHDQGIFIRDAHGNEFAHGLIVDNAKNGVYFDMDNQTEPQTCALDTKIAGVTIRGSGQYGAWLNFPCKGNHFEASTLVDNTAGCFGGDESNLIGKSETTCVAAEKLEPPDLGAPRRCG